MEEMVYDPAGLQKFRIPVNITHDITYLEYKTICIEIDASPLHRVEIGFEVTPNRNIRIEPDETMWEAMLEAIYNDKGIHPNYTVNWREQSELQSTETFIPKGRYDLDIRAYEFDLWNETLLRPIYNIFIAHGMLIRDPLTYDYGTDADKAWNENEERTVPDNPNRFDFYIGKHIKVEIEDDTGSLLKIDRVLRKDDDGYYVQINRRKQYLDLYWLGDGEFY